MNQVFTLIVAAMTAVHAVFGCCTHHPHACASGECEKPESKHSCSAHSHHGHDHHGHQHPANESSQDDDKQPADVPHSHDCQGIACVWYNPDSSSDDLNDADDVSPALPAQIASVRLDGGAHNNAPAFIDTSPPLRSHLLLQVLLI